MKAATAAAAASGASTGAMINNISIPLFGAPLTVLGMAALGVFLSVTYAPPEVERKKLFMMSIAYTFLAALGVVLIPAWLGWGWVKPGLQAPLAGAVAFAARWVVPVMIEQTPEFVRGWFNRLKPKTSGEKK
jgi:hypothetical protein